MAWGAVEGTVCVDSEKIRLEEWEVPRGMTSYFQIFEVLSGGREITVVLCSSRGHTQSQRIHFTGKEDQLQSRKHLERLEILKSRLRAW